MTETVPGFDDLLGAAQRIALHLEMRDTYAGGSPAFAAWRTGRPYDRSAPDARWRSLVAPLAARGVQLRRARIVSEPVSDYIRFEYEVTAVANLAAGEQVRWLPRRRASDLALPGNDFWLIDDRVLFNHFTGDGDWIDVELVTDASIVKFCASAFESVWDRGVDHERYRPA